MNKTRLLLFCQVMFMLLVISCKKEKVNTVPPSIEFIKDSGFVYSDTAVSLGTNIKIGIRANSSDANITYLNVRVDNGMMSIALDSGTNAGSLYYVKNIIKDNSATEKWTFTVMDKDRNKSSISINLNKKPTVNYGEIITYPQIILGAQDNTAIGSFLSCSNGSVFNYEQAANNQEIIDIIYYYGTYMATLASPLENEAPGFFPGLEGWTIKNETKYDTTTVTPVEFDLANNDSLILAEYDQVNGKRKAKYLTADMVISFRTHSGKIGLIKVISVTGTNSGTLNLAIKIQK